MQPKETAANLKSAAASAEHTILPAVDRLTLLIDIAESRRHLFRPRELLYAIPFDGTCTIHSENWRASADFLRGIPWLHHKIETAGDALNAELTWRGVSYECERRLLRTNLPRVLAVIDEMRCLGLIEAAPGQELRRAHFWCRHTADPVLTVSLTAAGRQVYEAAHLLKPLHYDALTPILAEWQHSDRARRAAAQREEQSPERWQ